MWAMSASPNRCGIVSIVTALVLLAAGCGDGTLSASALSKKSQSLQSLASEGALLARDASAGRSTRIFTRVHSEELAKAASKSAKSLRTATTRPALEPKLQRLTYLAGKLSADLKQLGHASSAAEQARLAFELKLTARALG